MPQTSPALVERCDDETGGEETAALALAGLLEPQKTLPPKLFYDEEGCRLFDLITQLPEYYVTRTEIALLERRADEIARLCPPGAAVIEYGAGSERKARILLSALDSPAAYAPIDIAIPALREAAARLAADFPDIQVHPVFADFTASPCFPPAIGSAPRLGFFPGSTIGNLEPAAAQMFLSQARRALGPGSQFLLGVDLRKEPGILVPAYDDPQGVTAAFNRNLLVRLNREAEADFVPRLFSHQAVWNERQGRIEMHLVSRCAQLVHVAGVPIRFAAGESIHTENSYKYSVEGFLALASAAGWNSVQLWTDPDALFSIHLLRSRDGHA